MAMKGESVCRLCRREGMKLYLKGDRCYSRKCGIERRQYPPGQHGQSRRPTKLKPYGIQLREKQKLRRVYRVLERQFRNYVAEAERRKGVTGENIMQLLEMRLDNVVYRLGLASSRNQARQFVSHGHILVNGRRVTIPSYQTRVGEAIEVASGSKQMPAIIRAVDSTGGRALPPWLAFDASAMKGQILAAPARDEIDTDVQESLIVEFYSR